MNKKVAKVLLDKKAVMLNPNDPYTYVSGIRSPIYCDNRSMIAFPKERGLIVKAFIDRLKKYDYDVLAGTSTAGIPWASFIAHELNIPMAYIRSEKKDHGAGKQIEGANLDGKKVIVIEDLISTGGSSFAAVEACREVGAEVVCVIAIFTYEFEKAKEKFEKGNCELVTLSEFSTLVDVALEIECISEEELDIILEWNKDPSGWGPKHGFPNAK